MHQAPRLGAAYILATHKRPGDQMSDNRNRQQWTPADADGRSFPGQTCCRAGSPCPHLASGREADAQDATPVRRCDPLPNHALLDQGGSAALRRARPRSHRAAALGGRPGRRTGHHAHDPMIIWLISAALRELQGVPSSSACQCPSRGRRIKGASGVARDRFATLDPPTAHKGFGAYEEDGGGMAR